MYPVTCTCIESLKKRKETITGFIWMQCICYIGHDQITTTDIRSRSTCVRISSYELWGFLMQEPFWRHDLFDVIFSVLLQSYIENENS